MEKERITYLYHKYLDKNCTDAEFQEFKTILADSNLNEQLKEVLDDELMGLVATEISDVSPEKSTAIFNYVTSYGKKTYRKPKLWTRWAVAASVAIAVATGGYFYYNNQIVNGNSAIVNQNDIAPGKNGATLTLANGKKIYINDALAGNIANEAGVTITKTTTGQLLYAVSPLGGDAEGRGGFNTLTTAKGETYQVRLPDGTLVFLNAESSLKYPASFAGVAKREVVLTGEAYFEVASKLKDQSGKQKAEKVPFIVVTNSPSLGGGQKVEVLGTHFNINSYANEPSIKTTLVEGSVNVTPYATSGVAPSPWERAGVRLKPNQQSTLTPSGTMTVAPVNTDDVTAWTNGKFVFEQEDITSVMRKLARWYNVEVVYQGNFEGKTFTGSISRYDNISKILDKITFTEALRFKIEGRRITVMP